MRLEGCMGCGGRSSRSKGSEVVVKPWFVGDFR